MNILMLSLFIFTPDGISYTDPASAALVSTHYFNDSIITRSLYNESVSEQTALVVDCTQQVTKHNPL